MYKVSIRMQKNKNKESIRQFELGEIDSPDYEKQMDAISDYLYDLDIPFEDDEDGDMLLDDILIRISEEEDFEENFMIRKVNYSVSCRRV